MGILGGYLFEGLGFRVVLLWGGRTRFRASCLGVGVKGFKIQVYRCGLKMGSSSPEP